MKILKVLGVGLGVKDFRVQVVGLRAWSSGFGVKDFRV